MHRRGFKGRLSSQNEERFLDEVLLDALEQMGKPGRITFEKPDVIITTVAEFEEILGQSGSCNDADLLAITLGPNRCGVWLEEDVLLDDPKRGAERMIEALISTTHGSGTGNRTTMAIPHPTRRYCRLHTK